MTQEHYAQGFPYGQSYDGYEQGQNFDGYEQGPYAYDQQGGYSYDQQIEPPIAQPPPVPELPNARELFPRLVQRLQEAGAVVSPKLKRASVAPLHVPGLVAEEKVDKGELLLFIPAQLQLTLEAAESVGGRVVDAATSLSKKKVRIECPGLVAFITWWMNVLEPRGLCRPDGDDNWYDASWFDFLLGMQLRADFPHMPHRRLTEDAKAREALQPSPEVHNADWNERAHVDAFKAMQSVVSEDTLGPSFTMARFAKSHLVLLTRTFGKATSKGTDRELVYVPVADMLNHSPSPNASWEFDADGSFSLTARKKILKSSEVLISYGRGKSNVRLFRTYGFTLEPRIEPCWSFRIWPSEAESIFNTFSPKRWPRHAIDLETNRIDDTLQNACQACAENDQEPELFLRKLCEHFSTRYTTDSLLQPAMLMLRQVRAKDARSAAWWSNGEDAALQPFVAAMGGVDGDRDFAASALRVKMSEYLCLLVHLEALQLISGQNGASPSPEEVCLGASIKLSELLAKSFHDTHLAREAMREGELRKRTAHKVGPDEWFELLVDTKVTTLGWVPDDMAPKPMITYTVQEDAWAERKDLRYGDELVSIGWMDVESLNERSFQAAMRHRPLHLLFYRHGEETFDRRTARPEKFQHVAKRKLGALPQVLEADRLHAEEEAKQLQSETFSSRTSVQSFGSDHEHLAVAAQKIQRTTEAPQHQTRGNPQMLPRTRTAGSMQRQNHHNPQVVPRARTAEALQRQHSDNAQDLPRARTLGSFRSQKNRNPQITSHSTLPPLDQNRPDPPQSHGDIDGYEEPEAPHDGEGDEDGQDNDPQYAAATSSRNAVATMAPKLQAVQALQEVGHTAAQGGDDADDQHDDYAQQDPEEFEEQELWEADPDGNEVFDAYEQAGHVPDVGEDAPPLPPPSSSSIDPQKHPADGPQSIHTDSRKRVDSDVQPGKSVVQEGAIQRQVGDQQSGESSSQQQVRETYDF